jgi:hypothetical protein
MAIGASVFDDAWRPSCVQHTHDEGVVGTPGRRLFATHEAA